jgi:hypothetical protein
MLIEEHPSSPAPLHLLHGRRALPPRERRRELLVQRRAQGVDADPARVLRDCGRGVVEPGLDVFCEGRKRAELAPDAGACEFRCETRFVALDGGAEAVRGGEGDAAFGEEEVVG